MARAITVQILGDSSSLERAFKRSAASAGRFNSEITKAGKSRDIFGGFAKSAAGMTAGFAGAAGITGFIQKAITDASDLTEQLSRSKVVFGESSGEVLAWSKTTAGAFKISQEQALEATGTFGAMLVPMGIARDKAADMSKALTELAGDLASMHGGSTADALSALTSGLAGEAEPLRKYGVFLSDAAIKSQAAALGFMKGANAAKASKEAYKDAGESFKTAHTAQTKATRELTSAQSKLRSSQSAVESSAHGVETAQENLYQSTQAVTDAENRQKDSADRLTTSKLTLRDAQNASKAAQISLTQARKTATEQLKALKDSTIDASLSEKRAQLSLAQARARLKEVNADSSSTELDRRDALLSVQEAERGAQEAAGNRKDLAKKIKDADKKGVEGSQEVVDARERVAEAHENEQQAARGVAAASRAFAAAQAGMGEALRKVAQSQQAVAEAQTRAQTAVANQIQAQTTLAAAQDASRKANERAKKAEDALNAAKEKSQRLNKGRGGGLTAEQKALATYATILDQSKIAQGDAARTGDQFAGASRGLKANIDELSGKLGTALLPSITNIVNSLVEWFSESKNQESALNTIKGVVETLKTAVDVLKGAFDLLSGAVGGNRNAIKLLIGMYATFKVAQFGGTISKLAGNFSGLTGKMRGSRTAAGKFKGSLAGKAGVAGAVVLASWELSNLIRKIPGWDKAMKEFGASIYGVATNLGLIKDPTEQFKGKVTPNQAIAKQIRAQAKGLIAKGLTPQQAANQIALQRPGMAKRDIEVLSGARASTVNINGPVHINGVTMKNLGDIEEGIHKRARQRPHRRRGS